MTDLVVYKISDISRFPANLNLFNCHICKARHFSYPEAEGHYLTQHTNVIVVLQENGKMHINRHFVGPRSQRPKYLMEKLPRVKGKPSVTLVPSSRFVVQQDKGQQQKISNSIFRPLETVKLEDGEDLTPVAKDKDESCKNLETLEPDTTLNNAAENKANKQGTKDLNFADCCEPPKKIRKTASTQTCNLILPEANGIESLEHMENSLDLDILGDITLDEVLEFSLLLEKDFPTHLIDWSEGLDDLFRASN